MRPLCAQDGVDPSWFDHDSTDVAHSKARRVCDQCPLAAQCYSQAVTDRMSGIWGGVLVYDGLRPGQRRSDLYRPAPKVRETRTTAELTRFQAEAARVAAMQDWADSTVATALRRARLEGAA